jgi:hypothetical protein
MHISLLPTLHQNESWKCEKARSIETLSFQTMIPDLTSDGSQTKPKLDLVFER